MLEEIKIENMIYEIRDKQVMLDSDLAKLYGCKNGTKEINQAVKNNLEKFPERFSWKLTDIESQKLLVKIFDQKFSTSESINLKGKLSRNFLILFSQLHLFF